MQLHMDWDDDDDLKGNVQHIMDSELTKDEVEDVIFDPDAKDGFSKTSGLPAKFGYTSTGRYIIVVYKYEDSGSDRVIRPISAYDIDPYN